MKNISYLMLVIPVAYAGSMLSKTPTLSDALIVIALSSLVGFIFYLQHKYTIYRAPDTEISKLQAELELERIKLQIDHIKESGIREKAIRDSQRSVGNFGEKPVTF